jgi:hypothetical protein
MIRPISLLPMCLAFALAAYVTWQVNHQPGFANTPQLQSELSALLTANDLPPQPLGDPPGRIIDGALRFAAPGCATDSFLLPVAGLGLAGIQAVRFSELTGASYRSDAMTIAGDAGLIRARLARAYTALRAAFGTTTARHQQTVLVFFTPVDCQIRLPDMREFWKLPDANP